MIVRRHIKQDRHYVNIALITGQRACQIIEEEEPLWEETDHKVEEEGITIKIWEEVGVEEEETGTKDRTDIIGTIRDKTGISEEIIEEI